ncbi:MAG: LexA family transcriptional regulator [Flavobacteriaceae bacterium]
MEKKLPIEVERFKKVREETSHTQLSFAEVLGIKASTADIERGKTKLSGAVVMKLMELFHINPLWLYGKSFEQYIEFNQRDVGPKVISVDLNNEDTILLVNQKAVAGYPHNIQDVEWVGSLPAFTIPLPQFKNATYRGFQVEGDSMLPNIRPNEWVLGRAVQNISEASDSKIYIVVLRDSVLVKKLQKVPNASHKVKLISLNPEYPPITIDTKDIQELWMVNSKLTFGVEEASESNLLRQLQQSMEELKGQIKKLSS